MAKKKEVAKKVGKKVVKGEVTFGMEIINGEEHTVTKDKKGKLISKSIL